MSIKIAVGDESFDEIRKSGLLSDGDTKRNPIKSVAWDAGHTIERYR